MSEIARLVTPASVAVIGTLEDRGKFGGREIAARGKRALPGDAKNE